MPLELRPLEQGDFNRGFLETLANLVEVGLTPEEAIHIWRGRNAAGVRTVVAVENGQIAACPQHKFCGPSELSVIAAISKVSRGLRCISPPQVILRSTRISPSISVSADNMHVCS